MFAWAASNLRRYGIPPDEIDAVVEADDPQLVSRYMELHREATGGTARRSAAGARPSGAVLVRVMFASGEDTAAAQTGSLLEEEEHADWLETELSLIERVGEANHLAQQIGD